MKIPFETMDNDKTAFTLVEVLVAVALIALLISLTSIRVSHIPKVGPRQLCAMNIEAIEGAKEMWMAAAKKSDNDVATPGDLKPFFKGCVFPVCPQGGVYTIHANSIRATCSVDAPRPAAQ